jgi:hypothetical protein
MEFLENFQDNKKTSEESDQFVLIVSMGNLMG